MPLSLQQMAFNGPIPGESLTQAPKSRPYEKPAQFNTVDQAMKYLVQQFGDEKHVHMLLALLEAGAPMDVIVYTLLMHGFGEGKWSPNLMLLLIGPVSHMLTALAKKAGIKYITSYRHGQDDGLDELYDMISRKKAQGDLVKDMPNPDTLEEGMFDTESPDNEQTENNFTPPSGGLMSPTKSLT